MLPIHDAASQNIKRANARIAYLLLRLGFYSNDTHQPIHRQRMDLFNNDVDRKKRDVTCNLLGSF